MRQEDSNAHPQRVKQQHEDDVDHRQVLSSVFGSNVGEGHVARGVRRDRKVFNANAHAKRSKKTQPLLRGRGDSDAISAPVAKENEVRQEHQEPQDD